MEKSSSYDSQLSLSKLNCSEKFEIKEFKVEDLTTEKM